MSRSVETLVIGAGISGLAYAHARGPDADLLVLEASDGAGGWVRTERGGAAGELRYERGPEALQSGSAEVLALCAELGLDLLPAPREARARYLLRRGELHALPRSLRSFLGSPLLSFRGKLRLLMELRRDAGVALDGSLADFVRHRFGPEAVEALLDPFVSGVHAGDAEQLSLRATFPALARMVEEHGSLTRALWRARGVSKARRAGGRRASSAPALAKPEGGMGALPAALAARLGARLRLGMAVQALRRQGAGFRVEAQGVEGQREAFDCARLVVATPGRAAAGLLADVAPEAARALATQACESLVSVLHAWPRERVAHPLDGFGYLVPSRERQRQLGTLFSSSIDPGCAPAGTVLLRTLAGGARHPRLVEETDETLLALVQREVAPLLGLSGAPVWSRVLRHRAALPRYDLAHPARLAAIDAALARAPGLHLLGNFLRGIGVPSLIEAARSLCAAHRGS